MQRNEDGMVRDLAQNFKLGVRITQAHVNIVRGCGCPSNIDTFTGACCGCGRKRCRRVEWWYLMVKHLKAAFLFQKHGLAHHFRSVPLVGVLVVGMSLCVDAGVSKEA